jgi:hypothetical protein
MPAMLITVPAPRYHHWYHKWGNPSTQKGHQKHNEKDRRLYAAVAELWYL